MSHRRSPIHTCQSAEAALHHPAHLIKLGLKGPGLDAWRTAHQLDLPTTLHDVRVWEDDGVVARVDRNEVILETHEDSPLRAAVEHALTSPHPNLFRVEQQSATFDLHGTDSLDVLAQTCGFDFSQAPPHQIVYTRVAGVSCGVISLCQGDVCKYRIWVDYSYARYLWEQLADIHRAQDAR